MSWDIVECLVCSSSLRFRISASIYCSNKCRQKAYRDRNKTVTPSQGETGVTSSVGSVTALQASGSI